MKEEIFLIRDWGRLTGIDGKLGKIVKGTRLIIDNQLEVVENTCLGTIWTARKIESKTPIISSVEYETIKDGNNVYLEERESRSFEKGHPRYEELSELLEEAKAA